MDFILGILKNYVLVCAVAGWFVAHFIKCGRYVAKNKKFNIAVLMSSGGMPSSHSSTVCAMVTATARACGTSAPEFALAFIFAFIVMYDAAGVRRAAGQQAKILNKLVEEWEHADFGKTDKRLKELLGHTPFEVFAGAILGIVIAILRHGI